MLGEGEAAELGQPHEREAVQVAGIEFHHLPTAGRQPADAWDRITTARGLPVPDTDSQRAFTARLQPGELITNGQVTTVLRPQRRPETTCP